MRAYARLGSLAAVTLAAVTALAGAQPQAARRPGVSGTPVAGAPAGDAPMVADAFRSARTYQAVAAPVRLRIGALRVDGAVQRLGLRADGTIAVPKRTDVAGWYELGPRPGQPGPAVILGHVDSRTGPGIFVDLRTVRRGTLIRVDRADGSKVMFRVREVSQVSKTSFPTDLVYAPTLDPTLRLVTCGGSFDRERGSYRDNVIVFADQV
ncbi:class F sortase [Actinoplanes sp. ATCC 53533]|uniref:class F sortase n=1 Tax=Actinoplanes sp. ATCC 53533 TaxID=1288362 RepID=UPI000F7B2AED|nr:class F sortase [Actinoplanes sp. ATCC 53533]RSM72561.1 class F sortase [Actinoplanes sp. ATCC 53533]